MVKMKAVTASQAGRDNKEKDITCLLQYVITVDDETADRTKDQRKISPNFTTEVKYNNRVISETLQFTF